MSGKLFKALVVLAVMVSAPAITQGQLVDLNERDPFVRGIPSPPPVIDFSDDDVIVELCVALDASGSITAEYWDIQISGLAAAVRDPDVMPQSGIVRLSVVQFSTGFTPHVLPTVIDSQATANEVANDIEAMDQFVGTSNLWEGIEGCMIGWGCQIPEMCAEHPGNPETCAEILPWDCPEHPDTTWIIDMGTDGEPTMPPDDPDDPFPNVLRAEEKTINERDRAVEAGLDVLNALGVNYGGTPNPFDSESFLKGPFFADVPDDHTHGLVYPTLGLCDDNTTVCDDDEDCTDIGDGMCNCDDCWMPFEPGFVIDVPGFGGLCDDNSTDCSEDEDCIGIGDEKCNIAWVTAMRDKIAGEVPIEVALDVKPGSCPNPLNFNSQGVLPVAILGSDEFDVTEIDVSTVLLEGVPPIRSSVGFVAAPYVPFLGKDSCDDCTEMNDAYMDLTLKFERQAIVAALGDVDNRTCVVVTLTGELLNGRRIVGEDVVIVKN